MLAILTGLWKGSPTSLSSCQNSPFESVHSDFYSPFPGRQVASYQSFGMCVGLAGPTPLFLLFPWGGVRGVPPSGEGPQERVCTGPFLLTFLLCVLHSL